MATAVFGLFDTPAAANAVRNDLTNLGIPAGDIRMESQAATSTTTTSSSTGEDKSFWEEIKEMFGAGDESHYAEAYEEGTRRGGTLVSVNVSDEQADQVADVLRRHGAVDVDERATQWRSSGWQGYQSAAGGTGGYAATGSAAGSTAASTPGASRENLSTAGGQKTIEIAEEQLAVGKRQVARGGVRVVRRVIETPVEQSVSLREEHVDVQRRAADRNLTAAEANAAFKDRTVEVTETGEEAVAAKSARVVGEVVVGKEVTERTEKVQDTVRKTDVQVERVPGQDVRTTSEKTSDVDSARESDGKRVAADRS